MIATVKQELFGTKVYFTPLQLVNIYRHFEWNNDPELNRLDSALPFKEESFGAFKQRFEQLLYHPSMYSQDFEIHAADGTLIGVADVTNISEHNRHCSISMTFGDRNYWGRGYGRDAMAVLLTYCFDTLQMHRVMTQVLAHNDAWKRLVEGMGFIREGSARDFAFRDGVFWDKYDYAMLEQEWKNIED